jgi:3-oxoacyl-[acyl-carrier-protein] synthase-3
MIRAKIASVGFYLPERVLTNADLEKMVDTNDEWITKRTGIKERRIARPDETASDMGFVAAQNAISKAKISPEDIDIIICSTITGDYISPSTACLIQDKLGAKNAFAFDISAACSGFIYALSIAEKFILADPHKTVLVVSSEKLSSITNWEDRSTCILFGDGAGAAVLKASTDGTGIISSYLKSDGSLYDFLMVKAGGSKHPATLETIANKEHCLTMNGSDVFKHAVGKMCESAEKTLEISGWKPEDLSMLFPHQANIRIIEAIKKKLDLDEDKVFINLHKLGNTSAATIPISLAEAENKSLLNPGDKILLVSFGGGFTWGGMTIIW